eukprot:1365064-Pleurochrysis_carterae.AAC.2
MNDAMRAPQQFDGQAVAAQGGLGGAVAARCGRIGDPTALHAPDRDAFLGSDGGGVGGVVARDLCRDNASSATISVTQAFKYTCFFGS